MYLIDTQVMIWALVNRGKLSASAFSILTNTDNVLLVSHISLFEIVIKQQLNKLAEFTPSTNELIRQLAIDDFQLLPIQAEHIAGYTKLPFHEDHRDPFDRLLLATAFAENIPIISADAKFQRYIPMVEVIW